MKKRKKYIESEKNGLLKNIAKLINKNYDV